MVEVGEQAQEEIGDAMGIEKEARQAGKHGRAMLESKQIVTRDQVDMAIAILIGSAIMFGALITEAIGL